MFHFAGRGGYNSRQATVQERRSLALGNSTTFSLPTKSSFHLNSALRKSLRSTNKLLPVPSNYVHVAS